MQKNNLQKAIFAGGCFWCLDAVFRKIKGVKSVISGYSGGDKPNPTYEQVCTGNTNHAEAVQITFDPRIIKFEDLLAVFWSVHDPTSLNKQGADVGTQYRSAIFYYNKDQLVKIKSSIAKLKREKVFDEKIVTEISPVQEFYPAEDYHQNYFAKNPNSGYCNVVINPKLTKVRQKFAKLLKN